MVALRALLDHAAAQRASSARVASIFSGGVSSRDSVPTALRRPMRARSTRPGSGSEASIFVRRVGRVVHAAGPVPSPRPPRR